MPYELIYRDAETGIERLVEFNDAPSHPIPQVALKVIATHLNGRDLTIDLSGQVWDALSEIVDSASSRVQSIYIKVNGEIVKTLPIVASGGGQLPWKVCSFSPSFETSITIPEVDGDCLLIRAETSENSAGNKGWREVVVALGWDEYAYTDPANLDEIENGLHIAFSGVTSETAPDTLRAYFGNRAPDLSDAVFTETSNHSLVFSGSISVNGALVLCQITLSESVSADSLRRESYLATAQYGSTSVTGVWYETSIDTNIFVLDSTGTQMPARPSRKVLMTSVEIAASKAGWTHPMLWRSQLPDGLAESDALKLKVNGVEQTLKDFTYSPKKYYIVKNSGDNRPQLFVVTAENLPEALALNPPAFSLSSSGTNIAYNIVIGEGEEAGTEAGKITFFEDDFGSINPAQRVHEDLTDPTLLTYFRLLYGEDGLKLLGWFQQSGGAFEIVELGSLLNLWSTKLDVVYPDPETKKIKIRLDKGVNPIQGAHLLWQGLQQSLPLFPFKEIIFAKAAAGETYGNMGFSYSTMKAMNQQIADQAMELGQDALNIYLSGLSIVNEGADWVVTIHEVSEGNKVALASLLPFVTAGTVVIVKDHAGKVIGHFAKEVADVLKQVFVPWGAGIRQARARINAMGTPQAVDRGRQIDSAVARWLDTSGENTGYKRGRLPDSFA